jgi:hypothetical protein
MTLDIKEFREAINPLKPLDIKNSQEDRYYINFSEVRGNDLIEELKNNITFFSPNRPTCQLFTGHVGCGKSTELLRLKAKLENDDFHVIYMVSSKDLEMGDVDVGDILLAIAHQVSEKLKKIETVQIRQTPKFKNFLESIFRLFREDIEWGVEASIPGIGKLSGDTKGDFSVEAAIPGLGEFNVNQEGLSLLALGIGKITAKTKNSPELRNKLREYLGSKTSEIIDLINKELLNPAEKQLKQLGKKGLVLIIDNLDRLENVQKPWGTLQPEYLFVERGEQLLQLNCHVVYTIPLKLMFSNDFNRLTARFGESPFVLPMIPVKFKNGDEHLQGIELLQQMVLARAFPDLNSQQRLDSVNDVFDSIDVLNRLCRVSGGHVRNLLMILNELIRKEKKFTLSGKNLEEVIQKKANEIKRAVDARELILLRKVHNTKEVNGDREYQSLIQSMFVFEYVEDNNSWFDVNPLIIETRILSI